MTLSQGSWWPWAHSILCLASGLAFLPASDERRALLTLWVEQWSGASGMWDTAGPKLSTYLQIGHRTTGMGQLGKSNLAVWILT